MDNRVYRQKDKKVKYVTLSKLEVAGVREVNEIVMFYGVLFYGVLGAGNGTGLHNPQPAIHVYIHDVFVRFGTKVKSFWKGNSKTH
jgi:hypothetical protein